MDNLVPVLPVNPSTQGGSTTHNIPAWDGSGDSVPAFLWSVVRWLQLEPAILMLIQTGCIWNPRTYKTVYANLKHFHKCEWCDAHGVVHNINNPLSLIHI